MQDRRKQSNQNQNPPQQKWLQKGQSRAAKSADGEVEEIVQPEANDSSSQGCNTQLPPQDTHYRTEDVTATKGNEFGDCFLKYELLMGIYEKGFEKLSPVQEESIPVLGKTAAFCIPVLEKNDQAFIYAVIILVLTTELSLQTSLVCNELGKSLMIQLMVTICGTSLRDDMMRLYQPVHLLVGTLRGACDLKECNILVIDEADKLLSLRFQPSVEELIHCMLETRQILMFSPTFPANVKDVQDRYLKNPYLIKLMDKPTLKGVAQYYALVEEREKVHGLNTLFSKLQINQSIIFCNSVNQVEILANEIRELGYSCSYLHEQMPQEDHNRVLDDFHNGAFRNLVCTDLLNRGIDNEGVNVVINIDLPNNSGNYLHRVRQCVRFGRLGLAVNLITFPNRFDMYKIEHELGIEIQSVPAHINLAICLADLRSMIPPTLSEKGLKME